MYQRLTLVGNLGRDPELRYTPNGLAITQMNIATSEKRKAPDGELKEQTIWWRVSVFGKQAETCNQYLLKGSRVLVEGDLVADEKTGSPRIYERKDGTYGSSFEVRANVVRFLTSRQSGVPQGTGDESGENNGESLDLPF